MNRSNQIFMTRLEVTELVCLAKTSLYLQIKKGTFPAPYKLGERMARWKRGEILEWIDNLEKAVPEEAQNE